MVITFLPRSKCLLISWLQSPSAVILEPPKITVSSSISHEVMGQDAISLVFWMFSFKPAFSLSPFTFIKKLFNYSLLPAIRVVSSAYLRLLIFLPAILILACASSSPPFLMMYSAYKLNKQGDNIQPWRTLSLFIFFSFFFLFFLGGRHPRKGGGFQHSAPPRAGAFLVLPKSPSKG